MFKWVYRIFLGLVGVITLLLILSMFPVAGFFKVMIVQSGSMEPAIHTGSIVVVKAVDKYNIDDIITFGNKTTNQTPTTHRITEIKNDNGNILYTTKGDANNGVDRKEIMQKNIIGKVLFSVPYLGYIIDFVKKPLGFSLVVIIPGLLIVSDEVKKIWLEAKKIKKKKIEDKNISK
jgi:signal peptidase I